VVIKGGVLRIRDQERRLLAKVSRSKNRLFLLDLKVEQLLCLAAQCTEESWLWHGCYGHFYFNALGKLAAMVRGMPNSCLVGKQRRLLFPKVPVHGDLCGPITPATHGGRRYFLLLVDDCSRYMWLQLLASKGEAADAIKHFKETVEAESGKKLNVLRTDRGGKFTA